MKTTYEWCDVKYTSKRACERAIEKAIAEMLCDGDCGSVCVGEDDYRGLFISVEIKPA